MEKSMMMMMNDMRRTKRMLMREEVLIKISIKNLRTTKSEIFAMN